MRYVWIPLGGTPKLHFVKDFPPDLFIPFAFSERYGEIADKFAEKLRETLSISESDLETGLQGLSLIVGDIAEINFRNTNLGKPSAGEVKDFVKFLAEFKDSGFQKILERLDAGLIWIPINECDIETVCLHDAKGIVVSSQGEKEIGGVILDGEVFEKVLREWGYFKAVIVVKLLVEAIAETFRNFSVFPREYCRISRNIIASLQKRCKEEKELFLAVEDIFNI